MKLWRRKRSPAVPPWRDRDAEIREMYARRDEAEVAAARLRMEASHHAMVTRAQQEGVWWPRTHTSMWISWRTE